jgi:hypothetical protein
MTKPTPEHGGAHRAISVAALPVVVALVMAGCAKGGDTSAEPSTSTSPLVTTSSATVAPMSTTTSPEAPMLQHPDGLWPLVAALSSAVPLTPTTFGTQLHTPVTGTGHDEHTSVWEGSPISLADGVVVTSSELRADPGGEWGEHGLATLDVAGRCVGVEEIKSNYPNARFTGRPEDLGGGPPPRWSSPQPWGTLHFTLNRTPTPCLTNVIFTAEQS